MAGCVYPEEGRKSMSASNHHPSSAESVSKVKAQGAPMKWPPGDPEIDSARIPFGIYRVTLGCGEMLPFVRRK
jgi:hypothetical protein